MLAAVAGDAWSALQLAGLVAAVSIAALLFTRGARARGGSIALEGLFYLAGPVTTVLIGFYPLAPVSLPGVTGYVDRALLVIAAGLVIVRLVDGPRKGSAPVAVAVILFSASLFASALVGSPGSSIPEPYWATTLIVLAFVLDPHMTADRLVVVASRAIRVVAVVSAIVAVLFPHLGFESVDPRTFFGIHRLQGITQQPNGLGFLVAFGLILEIYRRNWLWAGVMVTELLLTQSHTGWLVAGIAVIAIIGTRRRLVRQVSSVLGLIVLTFFALFPSAATRFLSDLSGDESLTLTGRTSIWAAAMHGFDQYPIFGYGPNLLDDSFRARWLPNAPYAAQAHNQWVQTLAGQGAVGAATLIILVATIAYFAWRSRHETRWYGPILLFAFVARFVTETPLRPVGANITTMLEVLVICFPLYAATQYRSSDGPLGSSISNVGGSAAVPSVPASR